MAPRYFTTHLAAILSPGELFGGDSSFNPRRSKPITKELPRGIAKITPYGVPICLAGEKFDYKGIRYDSEKFIYESPRNEAGSSVFVSCSQ